MNDPSVLRRGRSLLSRAEFLGFLSDFKTDFNDDKTETLIVFVPTILGESEKYYRPSQEQAEDLRQYMQDQLEDIVPNDDMSLPLEASLDTDLHMMALTRPCVIPRTSREDLQEYANTWLSYRNIQAQDLLPGQAKMEIHLSLAKHRCDSDRRSRWWEEQRSREIEQLLLQRARNDEYK